MAAIPIGAVIVLFVSGLSLAVASANAIYRDIEFVVAALLLPLFFLTPILYTLDNLPGAETHPWLDRPDPVGQSADPADRVLPGAALPRRGALDRRSDLPRRRDRVALVLGALVFTAVDDRIAAEV